MDLVDKEGGGIARGGDDSYPCTEAGGGGVSPTTLVKGGRAMIPRTFRQTTHPLALFVHLIFAGS